jgi:3-phosphoshikimate 1-carboxyvinyltransferase
VILTGDESLSRRPMARVVAPLRDMGASVVYLGEEGRLPLRIRGGMLSGREHRLAVPSAQVKSALLLAGLAARGRTRIKGAAGSRDHTERFLAQMGVPVQVARAGMEEVAVRGGVALRPFDIAIPGDFSSAAFLLAAAGLVPGSVITVEDVLLNPTRTGFLEALRAAGARVTTTPAVGTGDAWPLEPRGSVTVQAGSLRGVAIDAAAMPGVLDELPILAVLATQAAGETTIGGARELRVKECDRIAVMAQELNRIGGRVEELPDGWCVKGPTRLRVPESSADGLHIFATAGDHRIAMALAVAALVVTGRTTLDDPRCLGISFPGFLAQVAHLVAGGAMSAGAGGGG